MTYLSHFAILGIESDVVKATNILDRCNVVLKYALDIWLAVDNGDRTSIYNIN